MTRTGWQNPWIRAVTTLLTAAVMIFIFMLSTENAKESDKRSGQISLIIIKVIEPGYEKMDPVSQKTIYDEVQHVVRKCAHYTEYTVLGLVIRLCLESWFGYRMNKKRMLALTSLAAGTGYACTDEAHQTAIDGRSGQFRDVMVDFCGVLTGVMLGTIIIGHINSRISEKTKAEKQTEEKKDGVFQKQ